MEKAEIERLGERLLEESFPRLQMILILSLAGLGAFLSSVALLRSGIGSMSARYFLAAAIGYLLFLVLVRAWLAYQRNRWLPDPTDVPIDMSSDGGSAPSSFEGEGGSFAGGGASGSFDPVAESETSILADVDPVVVERRTTPTRRTRSMKDLGRRTRHRSRPASDYAAVRVGRLAAFASCLCGFVRVPSDVAVADS